jgi:protein tyrosine phosphatase (PTP) superfamily phosphohydrolase (DUF442 family)
MNRTVAWLWATALATLLVAGCQHPCRQPASPVPPPPVLNTVPTPGAPTPGPAAPYTIPPQGLPQSPAAPTPPPASIRGYEPPLAAPLESGWRPSTESGIRLAPPEEGPTAPREQGARLQSPEFTAPAPSKPSVGEQRIPTPLLPAGIPQFALADDQIAIGLKPMLDGVEWLQQNGYRTVLHLRQSEEDDAAERKLFEMRGLKYLSLEVSPQTLSPKMVEEFNRIVGDRSLRPLFIYDKTGVLTGGLWYLHFRQVDHLSDAEARQRAARLGLGEAADGMQREMWLAIQKYLSEPQR